MVTDFVSARVVTVSRRDDNLGGRDDDVDRGAGWVCLPRRFRPAARDPGMGLDMSLISNSLTSNSSTLKVLRWLAVAALVGAAAGCAAGSPSDLSEQVEPRAAPAASTSSPTSSSSGRRSVTATAAPSPPATVTTSGSYAFDPHASACRPSQLRLVGLGHISPMTGEHGFTVVFGNAGQTSCNLTGYPTVSFSDAVGRIPFLYQDGGGQYFNPPSPPTVTVPATNRPGVAFEIAKYRCDTGTAREATTLHFRLPGAIQTLTIPLTGDIGEDYCTGGPNDPGQLVYLNHPGRRWLSMVR